MMMRAALLVACGAVAASCAEDAGGARFIVRFKDEATHREFGTLAVENVGGGSVELDMPAHHAVAARLSAEGVAALERDARVAEVEIDHRRYVTGYVNPRELEPRGAPYGIAMVQADRVREVAGPRKVCIIDSGLDKAHPEFAGYSRVGGTDDRVSKRWSEDRNSHGTHVAGTIFGPRNGEGVVGVNSRGLLDVHIIKVFDADGWAYSSSLVGALDRCLDARSDIVSMSLGGAQRSSFEDRAFARAARNGALLIAAAGNDGTAEHSYPASYDSVMSVAAIDKNERHASFSQRTSQVEIAAPGVDVLSTVPRGMGPRGNRDYDSMDGTSMATPHVSGVAALVWNNVPECSAAQVRRAMTDTAKDLGPRGRDVRYGHGLVQAKAMLDRLETVCGSRPVPPPPPAPVPVPVPVPSPGTCTDKEVNGRAWYTRSTKYSCAWFSSSRCESYGGSRFSGEGGLTAKDACCVCGGGEKGAGSVPGVSLSLAEDNGRAVRASAGSITDGSGPYPANVDRSVSVTGRNCVLTWRSLDVEAHSSCAYDYVTVRKGSKYGSVVGRFCGATLPAPVKVAGSGFSVVLHSDGSQQGAGFDVDFVCE